MSRLSDEDRHELRQQMYCWLIAKGFASDRGDAKEVAKKNGFLQPQHGFISASAQDKIKGLEKEVKSLKEKISMYEQFRKSLNDFLKQ